MREPGGLGERRRREAGRGGGRGGERGRGGEGRRGRGRGGEEEGSGAAGRAAGGAAGLPPGWLRWLPDPTNLNRVFIKFYIEPDAAQPVPAGSPPPRPPIGRLGSRGLGPGGEELGGGEGGGGMRRGVR